MINTELVDNLLALVLLSVFSGFVDDLVDRKTILGKILQGILFGIIVIFGITFSYDYMEGIVFDGRSIVISLSTLFFGPLSGIITVFVALFARAAIGGTGLVMGIAVIFSSFLLGYLGYYLRKTYSYRLVSMRLLFFGIIVHIFMMLCTFLLPSNIRTEVQKSIMLPVLALYPVLTLLMGKILLDQEQKKIKFSLSKSNETLFRETIYSISDGIITIDTFGTVMQMNRIAEGLTGWQESEALKQTLTDVFIVSDTSSGKKLSNSQIVPLQGVSGFEPGHHFILHSRSLGNLPITFDSSPIKDENNYKIGSVLVFRDLTNELNRLKQIEESSNRFKAIFDESRTALAIISGTNGIVENVNSKMLELTGFAKQDLVGKKLLELNIFASGIEKQDILDRFQAKQDLTDVPITILNNQGIKKQCLLYVDAFYERNSEFLLTSLLDISDRMDLEKLNHIQSVISKAMSSSKKLSELFILVREQLSTLMDTTNFTIAFYDEKTGRLTAPNGIDEKDVLPQFWYAENSLTGYLIRNEKTLLLNKSEIFRIVEENQLKLIGTPSECWLGTPLRTKKGIIGAIIVQSYSNKNAYDKRSAGMLETIASQIALYLEKKYAEEEALKLSKAIIQSPVSIVITDLKGTIEFVNPKFTDVTGYTFEEAVGKNPRILKSGIHEPEFYKNMWECISSGKEWKGEFLNKKKNGELIWELASITPILDENGNISHYLGVKEDITSMKLLQEDLIKARDQAELSDRLKTIFLQNMSHEIRTPLNGILGFSYLLKTEQLPFDKTSRFADNIHKSGSRLLHLVSNLIDISRIESGVIDVLYKDINLKQTVRDIVEHFYAISQEKNIPLILQLNDLTDDLILNSDPGIFNQVMTNLLNNAFKFTKTGQITVGFEAHKQEIVFYVQDTGIGIPKEKQTKIFSRFYQADSSLTREYEGAGLGLAICKGMLETIGGKIWFESEEKRGTTFYFSIPTTKELTN